MYRYARLDGQHEWLVERLCELLWLDSQVRPASPKLLRHALEHGIRHFPNNPRLLALYVHLRALYVQLRALYVHLRALYVHLLFRM